ncbi:hypothetical protein CLV44_13022 [Marinobacterium halophilum]|uniref:Uncharacterized protein n=1 Tax=Marinobacterium halophilum TaxID=267374 RepID=A0A2P8EJI6_9GAMM|nr:hypothetical protein CLV44_13022 [Marinobacterium halophilum]
MGMTTDRTRPIVGIGAMAPPFLFMTRYGEWVEFVLTCFGTLNVYFYFEQD